MLAPVGIVNNRVEDREAWKQPGRQPPRPGKRKKDTDKPKADLKPNHIDIKA